MEDSMDTGLDDTENMEYRGIKRKAEEDLLVTAPRRIKVCMFSSSFPERLVT